MMLTAVLVFPVSLEYNKAMIGERNAPNTYPFPAPEVVPGLVHVPDTKKETPIEVINGALEEFDREEKDEGRNTDRERGPTIH